jgi:putative transposase
MKRIDFTESQIVEILREARSSSIDAVAQVHNITAATIYAWRAKYGQLGTEDIKRLRHLNNGHARRQRLISKNAN